MQLLSFLISISLIVTFASPLVSSAPATLTRGRPTRKGDHLHTPDSRTFAPLKDHTPEVVVPGKVNTGKPIVVHQSDPTEGKAQHGIIHNVN